MNNMARAQKAIIPHAKTEPYIQGYFSTISVLCECVIVSRARENSYFAYTINMALNLIRLHVVVSFIYSFPKYVTITVRHVSIHTYSAFIMLWS